MKKKGLEVIINEIVNYIIIIPLIFIFNCSGEKENAEADNELKVNTHRIRKGKLNSKDWNCYKVDHYKICCPTIWELAPDDNFLFYSHLEEAPNPHSFFVINTIELDSNNTFINKYLKEMYYVLTNDTTEVLKEYKLNKLIFSDKSAYYGEFLTEIGNRQYYFYLMLWELDGLLYDFGLKTNLKFKESYYQYFQDILYNFQIDNQYVFDEDDKLEEIRFVNINDL